MDYSEVPRISEFFRDRDVFLTGGTGSVGKALIEKLLYSCPDVGRIFMLVRPKKGFNKEERATKFKSGIIFNRLREKDASQLDKIIPISGDCMELNLGLCDEDRKLMENVSVVFHAAASIRFDDPLKDAILLNTRGTREVVHFAEDLKKLCVFVHISTAYCNPLLYHVEEKLYPCGVNWRDAVRIAETLELEELEIVAPFYMDFYPNSYTFAKCLAEHIINEYKERLPVVIFRPSIVTPAQKEPYPGWVDFINGPIAYTLPGSLGLNHVTLLDTKTLCDYIPLDIVIKALIVTSYVHGMKYESNREIPKLEVYNCAAGEFNQISIRNLIDYSRDAVQEWPIDQAIWSSSMVKTQSLFIFKFLGVFMQFLPGLILDFVAALLKKKRRLLPILRTICYATCKMQFFLLNSWIFDNSKCLSLIQHIKDVDRKDFIYNYYPEITKKRYINICAEGSRRYLLKQSDKTLQATRVKYSVIMIADYTSKVMFFIFILYIFLFKFLAKIYFNVMEIK